MNQPLVAAFNHLLDRIDLVDLAGNSVTVRIDVQHTPYKNFLLLSAPKRRIVRPRRVHVVGATAS